jgi:hypothetical protein
MEGYRTSGQKPIDDPYGSLVDENVNERRGTAMRKLAPLAALLLVCGAAALFAADPKPKAYTLVLQGAR